MRREVATAPRHYYDYRDGMTLRVVAVAAPELPGGGLGRHTLKSLDPASLFNACRVGAERAERGIGPWGDSNWAVHRTVRRDRVLLMHSLAEDLPQFEELLERERPDLLLLGAMSVCLPGAVACASRARELLGDGVFIVLGGRHATETVYSAAGVVTHHPASPARLIAEQFVPPVFDLVISGEGECVIAELGEVVARSAAKHVAADVVAAVRTAPGNWIASWCEQGAIRSAAGIGPPIDRNSMPLPAELFGVRAAFDVFDGRLTGHVFSDTGNGCVFDCDFCSERRSITGGLAQLNSAAGRLARQLRAVHRVIAEDSPARGASGFVEDSTLLGGSRREINRFANTMRHWGVDMPFGGQFTIDQILGRFDLLETLATVGLTYVFIGIETLDPGRIGGMSKDRRPGWGSWLSRSEEAVARLADIGVRTGAAVLFGLAEPHRDRLELLSEMARWRDAYGSPDPISLNWATQHPLLGNDGGKAYRYHEWSIPSGEWADAFRGFGEATVLYPVAHSEPPVLSEVRELVDLHEQLFKPTM